MHKEFARFVPRPGDLSLAGCVVLVGSYVEGLLDYYDQPMDLDGIINGKDRMRRVPIDKRFGVSPDYLKDLKDIKAGRF